MSVVWSDLCTDYLKLGAGAAVTAAPLLDSIGAAVQSAIERYTSRTLDAITYIEAYDGNDRPTLYLSHDPIQTVGAVSANGTALAVSTFVGGAASIYSTPPAYPPAEVVIHRNRSALVRTSGLTWPAGRSNIVITYAAGLDAGDGPPAALLQAGVEWIALLWKGRDRAGISSESAGGQTVTFTRDMPPFVKLIVNQFRRGYLPSV